MVDSHLQGGVYVPADEPPSYEATQLCCQMDSIRTVTMLQYQPGSTIGAHLIRSRKPLSEQADLISIPHHISYVDMLKLLHARFQARSGIEAPSKTMSFYCRIAIDHDGTRVLLDNDSWPAAKSLLLSMPTGRESTSAGKRTELVFMFAVKRRAERVSRARRLRGLLAKEDRGATCLIEPIFS